MDKSTIGIADCAFFMNINFFETLVNKLRIVRVVMIPKNSKLMLCRQNLKNRVLIK